MGQKVVSGLDTTIKSNLNIWCKEELIIKLNLKLYVNKFICIWHIEPKRYIIFISIKQPDP